MSRVPYRLRYAARPDEGGISTCTGDNPLALARELSPIQADKPWYNFNMN